MTAPEPTPTGEHIHWVSDAPTSLHGNGAASFALTTRDPLKVTCRLCASMLLRVMLGEDDEVAP